MAIKLILGGIGSGKSLTCINKIVKRRQPNFVNFAVKHKLSNRLETENIIIENETVGERGKVTKKKAVNWDFWRRQTDGFDIYLDEVHNILSSRRSMSSWNTLFSMWLAQIRKILGSTEKNDLYLVSQRLGAIDVTARELAQEIIACQKIEKIKNGKKIVYIINYYFRGEFCMEKYLNFKNGMKSYDYRTMFIGNNLFKYYNTREMVDFGSGVYI